MQADGGGAIKFYQVWQAVRDHEPINGTLRINPDWFRLAVPAAVLADDEERLEWIHAMKVCLATATDKTALLMPDDED